MKLDKDKFKFKVLLMSGLLLVACSSRVPKADLAAGADPQQELAQLNSDLIYGDINHFSILSGTDFQNAKIHGKHAEAKIRNNESRNEQLDEIRVARGYFERARREALNNRSKIEPIIDARELAVNSGALQYPNTQAQLESIDADARKLAEQKDSPTPGQVQRIQKGYNEVHVATLETIHLSGVKNQIEEGRRRNAENRAPQTFKQAQVDYVNAKNAIFVSRTNPEGFRDAVKRAIWTSQTLSDVLDIADRNGNRFNENEAVRMVWQDRQIQALREQGQSGAP